MRERLSMNKDWLFHLGEVEGKLSSTHDVIYGQAKAGGLKGPGGLEWNDNEWDMVQLPHDWSFRLPFDREHGVADFGYKNRGIGWYRKKFVLDEQDQGKQLSIHFDGIATHATIYFNGSVIHRNFCGYTSFSFDISDRAFFGNRPNVLAVRVNAEESEGWWYEGAGIYRNCWLTKTDKLHIAERGIWVNPQKQADKLWQTNIEATVRSEYEQPVHFTVKSTILDPQQNIVEEGVSESVVEPYDQVKLQQMIELNDPQLWDIEHPHLYTLKCSVLKDGLVVDELDTAFGYRTIRICPDTGFYLNERPIKIKGTCNHQDHAGVGVALPDELHAYRIKRLKEMGSNAYRAAHHNPAPELLDACDRLGMLVMDENRNFDSSEEGLKQVENMVTRDRNHPSVVMYSLFNEEPLQGTPIGRKMFKRMKNVIRRLDPTRPVLGAMNGGVMEDEGTADIMDITGFNYMNGAYEAFRAKHPQQPLIGSETVSAFSTRGNYVYDKQQQVFDSFDEQRASWGNTVRESWKTINTHDYIMGTFVWTGFDYRGEPTPYQWPSVSTHFGIMDTCGFPKDSYYLYQAFWLEEPVLHIVSHWNWPGLEGQPIKVMTHTNCDEVAVYVNGRLFDRQSVDIYEQQTWQIPYEPGTLTMEGYRAGKLVATAHQHTTGSAARLKIEPHKSVLLGDGRDAIVVNVHAVDEQGRYVTTANNLVQFSCEGSGFIAGCGNGNPNSHEADIASSRKLFNGSLQIIVQSVHGSENITLTFSGENLPEQQLVIPVQAAVEPPYVPSARDLYINDWFVTQEPQADKPDPHAEVDLTNMNTWENVDVSFGFRESLKNKGGYIMYRAQLAAELIQFSRLPQLMFQAISGNVEIYMNGKLQFAQMIEWNTEIALSLEPFANDEQLAIVVIIGLHPDMHTPGINGTVSVRNEKQSD